jgi:hypothetical protein
MKNTIIKCSVKALLFCLLAFTELTNVKAQTNNALSFNSANGQYVSMPHSSIFNITSLLIIKMHFHLLEKSFICT